MVTWMIKLALILMGLFILPAVMIQKQAWAETIQVQKCTICHGKQDFKKILPTGEIKALYVKEKAIKASVHANKSCTDCHADVAEIPHRTTPDKVNCARCHYKGNPAGAPQEVNYEAYRQSVHGQAVQAGKPKAPICQACHGSHQIRPHVDPASKINRSNIPALCGQCHIEAYAVFRESVHGQALIKENNQDVPVCTNCHGEHAIMAPKDPTSKVFPTHISESCSKCHAAVEIMNKYGIKSEQVMTFQESFHGVAGKFGSRTVASCASCHGFHDIRAVNDPKSSVYIKNIPQTCGKCHDGANINYARGKIHVNAKKKEAGIIYYVATFFKWLTISTMVGLIIHIFLDLNRRSREWRSKKEQ